MTSVLTSALFRVLSLFDHTFPVRCSPRVESIKLAIAAQFRCPPFALKSLTAIPVSTSLRCCPPNISPVTADHDNGHDLLPAEGGG
jgi:hypothetical protein